MFSDESGDDEVFESQQTQNYYLGEFDVESQQNHETEHFSQEDDRRHMDAALKNNEMGFVPRTEEAFPPFKVVTEPKKIGF